ATDATWQGSSGPIVGADLPMGELYAARLEMPGWDAPRFSGAGGWRSVEIVRPEIGHLVAQSGPPTRVTMELEPIGVIRPAPGVVTFDLGQNMVGTVRLTIRGAARGQRIVLRYGEMLKKDGRLYTLNL